LIVQKEKGMLGQGHFRPSEPVMKSLLVLISVAALAACASSGPTSQTDELTATATPAPASAEAKARTSSLQPGDPGYWDEEVCRREPVTGTRLTRARCHTRYDWARMSGAATEVMRDIESMGRPCGPGPGCAPGD
jgi:predicted small lipoprotein YifL